MNLIGISINDRFRLIEKFSQRPFINLYRAQDQKTGEAAIVCVFNDPVNSRKREEMVRFRSEVSACQNFDHPRIARVLAYGELFDLTYVVMDYRDGSLLSDILTSEPIDPKVCVIILEQTADALGYAHERGLVHRLLNPEFILMKDGSASLYGFGFSHLVEYATVIERGGAEQIFGYMAPEQGIGGGRTVDERSDLYSLGIIAYRILAGRLPFKGETASSIFYKHASVMPVPPSVYRKGIPPALEKVILKLMDKEPSRRYQNARALIADIGAISRGVSDFQPAQWERWQRLDFTSSFVGREKELRRLCEKHNESRNGLVRLCIIRGKAGMGKTRLVEEFKNTIYHTSGIFLAGRCINVDHKQPFAPFRDALDHFLLLFEGYSEAWRARIATAVAKELSDAMEAVYRLNPNIKLLTGESSFSSSASAKSTMKFFYSDVARFFGTIALLEEGMVLVLEDMQWADEGSFELLNILVSKLRNTPLFIICTLRDDMPHSKRLDMYWQSLGLKEDEIEIISLLPFTDVEMKAFISSLFPLPANETEQLAGYLLRRSGGMPFFASEILRQLVGEGILVYQDNAWSCRWDSLSQLSTSLTDADVILKRMRVFDEAEKDILRCASVIGKTFDIYTLFLLSLHGPDKVEDALNMASSLEFVTSEGGGKVKYAFSHDRIREALYENMPPEKRQELHRALAKVLAVRYTSNERSILFDLAHHAIEGEDHNLIIRYAYLAGLAAAESSAWSEAIRYFSKALESIEKTDIEAHRDIREESLIEIGGAFVRTGRYNEAIAILQPLLETVQKTRSRVRIYSHLCDAYYRKGDWNACEKAAYNGLGLLNEYLPRWRFAVILGIIKQLAVHILHSLFPSLFIRRTFNPRSDRHRMSIDFFMPLSMSYGLSDPVKLVRTVLRIMNFAERRIGPSIELAEAYAGFASICMAASLFDRSLRYHEKSFSMNKALGYEWGRAKNHELLGYYHEWLGSFDAARRHFEEALALFRKIGDTKEELMSLNGLEHCYYYTSHYSDAREVNDVYYEMAERLGDEYAATAAEIYYSQIYREQGEIEKALYHAEISNRRSRERSIWFNYCSSLVELGLNEIEKGEPASALSFLESARKLFEENSYLRQYILPVYPAIAQAHLDDYEKRRHSLSRGEMSASRAKIRRACARAIRKTKRWATHYGVALRVMARYCALVGNDLKAEKYFLQSIDICGRVGRRYEIARGHYDLGMHLIQKGDTNLARDHLERAYVIFNEIGATLYCARLRTVLRIQEDREISSLQRLIDKERSQLIAKTIDDIRQIADIEEALFILVARAMELVGAQACSAFIFKDEGGEPVLMAARNMSNLAKMAYDMSIIESARRARRPLMRSIDNHTKGAEASSPAHVICVPMITQEMVIGVCYAEDYLTGKVFNEHDAEILIGLLSPAALHIRRLMAQGLPAAAKERSSSAVVTQITEEKIQKVISYIKENYRYDLSREGLASMVDCSPNHLGVSFKSYTGKKIGAFINELRIREAAERLASTDERIIDIAFSVGFESLRTFNRIFLEFLGEAPTDYRRKRAKKET